MDGANDSIGVNYLELCDATTGKEAEDAYNVAAGMRKIAKTTFPGEALSSSAPTASGKPAMKAAGCSAERHCTMSSAGTPRPVPGLSWRSYLKRLRISAKPVNRKTT